MLWVLRVSSLGLLLLFLRSSLFALGFAQILLADLCTVSLDQLCARARPNAKTSRHGAIFALVGVNNGWFVVGTYDQHVSTTQSKALIAPSADPGSKPEHQQHHTVLFSPIAKTMMKLLTLLLATLYCASAFGLHSVTSQVKNLGFASASSKPMVQAIELQQRPSTVVSLLRRP